MARRVTVLGTVHEIQGAEKEPWTNIDDPEYSVLVKHFLQGKDFLFEEASQLGPTKAKCLAEENLGNGHYLDVDPHRDDRFAYGIGETGQGFRMDPCSGESGTYRQEFEQEQSKRESH